MIEACIVDDHNDVCPFIFAFWRHKKVLSPAILIHVDSHPDMSVPSCNKQRFKIADWRNKDTLLDEILTEEGAISEWILPLCAMNVVSQVVWIRPEWSSQLPDGACSFRVEDNPVDPDSPSECEYEDDDDCDSIDNNMNKIDGVRPQEDDNASSSSRAIALASSSSTAAAAAAAAAASSSSSTSTYSLHPPLPVLPPPVTVTLPVPYYIEEGVYRAPAAATTITTAQRGFDVHLVTCLAAAHMQLDERGLLSLVDEAKAKGSAEGVALGTTGNTNKLKNLLSSLSPTLPAPLWILDVCLDYFSVQNPFLALLQAALTEDILAYTATVASNSTATTIATTTSTAGGFITNTAVTTSAPDATTAGGGAAITTNVAAGANTATTTTATVNIFSLEMATLSTLLFPNRREDEKEGGASNIEDVVAGLVDIIQNTYRHLRCRNVCDSSISNSINNNSSSSNNNSSSSNNNNNSNDNSSNSNNSNNNDISPSLSVSDSMQALNQMLCSISSTSSNFTGKELETETETETKAEFLRLFEPDAVSQAHGQRMHSLLSLSLPLLSAKTRALVASSGFCILLPHHPSSEEEIREKMYGLEAFLKNLLAMNPSLGAPQLVTMAFSVDDGFTPHAQAQRLYESVRKIVDSLFGASAGSAASASAAACVGAGVGAGVGDGDSTASTAASGAAASGGGDETCSTERSVLKRSVLTVHDLRGDAVGKSYSLFLARVPKTRGGSRDVRAGVGTGEGEQGDGEEKETVRQEKRRKILEEHGVVFL